MWEKCWAGARMIGVCAFIALFLLTIGLPVLLYCRIVKSPALGLRTAKWLDRMVLFLAGIHAEVEGLENVHGLRSCVYVGNHRSMVDPPLAFYVLPGDVRFLAKKELFQIPVVSFALRTLGVIEVNRSDPEAAARSIDRAVDEIRSGRSVIIFPEGTRSRTKEMLPLKKGAFVLAIKSGAPVVPVIFLGTKRALQPDTIQLRGGKVRVIIREPIPTDGLALQDRDQLLSRVRTVLQETIAAHL